MTKVAPGSLLDQIYNSAKYKTTDQTRPANTTAYAAGDIVGGVSTGYFEITGLGLPNEVVRITAADMRINNSTLGTITYYTLYLYNSVPVSALTDNAPWTATGDEAIYKNKIALGNMEVAGNSIRSGAGDLAVDIQLSATGSLYIYAVTATGYTPTSGSIKTVGLYTVGG